MVDWGRVDRRACVARSGRAGRSLVWRRRHRAGSRLLALGLRLLADVLRVESLLARHHRPQDALMTSQSSQSLPLVHRHRQRIGEVPSYSLKRSANGMSRWPTSNGPTAHFALAVPRAMPSAPALQEPIA